MQLYSMIGAITLVCSGIAGAYALGRRAQGTLRQLDAVISFLRYVRIQVECFALPMSEILRRADPVLLQACGSALPAPARSEAFVASCRIADAQARQIMQDFAQEFGKGYRDEQLRLCDYHLSLLMRRREEIAVQLPKKKKMDATLCICLALAMVVLLL